MREFIKLSLPSGFIAKVAPLFFFIGGGEGSFWGLVFAC